MVQVTEDPLVLSTGSEIGGGEADSDDGAILSSHGLAVLVSEGLLWETKVAWQEYMTIVIRSIGL
jgi:hypothetical protein